MVIIINYIFQKVSVPVFYFSNVGSSFELISKKLSPTVVTWEVLGKFRTGGKSATPSRRPRSKRPENPKRGAEASRACRITMATPRGRHRSSRLVRCRRAAIKGRFARSAGGSAEAPAENVRPSRRAVIARGVPSSRRPRPNDVKIRKR